MPKLIAVEGPDGAGKSTLLVRLSHDLHFPVYHTGGPPASREMLHSKLEAVQERANSHLFDRVPHISEPIYSRASGKRMYMMEHDLHQALEKLDPIIIYCRLASMANMFRSIDQSKKVHKPRQHLEEVLQNYKSIVEDYDLTMRSLPPRVTVIQFSWETDSYPKLLEKIRAGGARCVV